MKGISVFFASLAGLSGAVTAFVGGFLLMNGQGLMGTVVGGVTIVLGLGIIGLGVWSVRS